MAKNIILCCFDYFLSVPFFFFFFLVCMCCFLLSRRWQFIEFSDINYLNNFLEEFLAKKKRSPSSNISCFAATRARCGLQSLGGIIIIVVVVVVFAAAVTCWDSQEVEGMFPLSKKDYVRLCYFLFSTAILLLVFDNVWKRDHSDISGKLWNNSCPWHGWIL